MLLVGTAEPVGSPLRFTLGLPDVEDLLAERGIAASFETIRH
jgi:transposase-like protein